MKFENFTTLFEKGKKHYCVLGGKDAGVLIGLDLEGRIFTSMDGYILNRINEQAVLNETTRAAYLNPGGDGLWPAPEGTRLGYEYSTGAWRVPPGLTGARYIVVEEGCDFVRIQAEVDLINNIGLGIPTIFEREVKLSSENGKLSVDVKESIQYIGEKSLSANECRLAPWTLCQFDSGPECEVVFPLENDEFIWDLYDSSKNQRSQKDGFCHAKTNGAMRYQIGLSKEVPWIEYRNPDKKMTVKRSAKPLPEGQNYIDIADAPPIDDPSEKCVCLSVYSDPSFFMEIEAAGGCPEIIKPGNTMSVEVKTIYSFE